ncbi:hypothetical protein C922_05500 [Plasmodium inui San Antonio 1]|uniref:Uncharacterized protein n=1 Tax=Plasmodium inui San Antonio 1 TaxID=1237626 RepID=W7A4U7_9APIC|nr:hypothetical protein C922_05500 [Plasmodium inui San Antonio 1]EUD64119.1 hypothetical protein C922_05500 [Plasmodium inui San Antonio 1]
MSLAGTQIVQWTIGNLNKREEIRRTPRKGSHERQDPKQSRQETVKGTSTKREHHLQDKEEEPEMKQGKRRIKETPREG